ncbi:MAG TPA: ATP-binding protein [Syntrophorhabdales bacterium]|nr:ATP-binding protein [Syntrophorhabdales bacterium]
MLPADNKDMIITRPTYTQFTLKEQLAKLKYAGFDDKLIVAKELLDNACDEAEKSGGPVEISLSDDARFTVTNRGKMTEEELDTILDLSVLLSAKYNHCAYTRGRIGLGLKYAIMLSYQDSDDKEFVIASNGLTYTIRLADRQALDPKKVLSVTKESCTDDGCVRVSVEIRDCPFLKIYVPCYITSNPHISFSFNGKGYPKTVNLEKETNVDIFSYSKEGFRAFARDHKKFASDFTYDGFVRLFGVTIPGELPTDWDTLYDLIMAHATRIKPPFVGQKAIAKRTAQLGYTLLRYRANEYPDGSAAEIAVLNEAWPPHGDYNPQRMLVAVNGSSVHPHTIRFGQTSLIQCKLPDDTRVLYFAYYSTTPRFEGQSKEYVRISDNVKQDIEAILKEKKTTKKAPWFLTTKADRIYLPEPYSRRLGVYQKTYDFFNECARIIDTLVAQVGLITVRQLYYRLVVEHIIAHLPEVYDKFNAHLVRARELGLIPYEVFTDRSRGERHPNVLALDESPEQFLNDVLRRSLMVPGNPDPWQNQPYHVELWIEKDALVPFFDRVATEKQVILFPCRGFSSLTKLHNAIVRFQGYIDRGKQGIRIVYAGDLDPSGWSIYENIIKRLGQMNKRGFDIVVDRFALLEDQVFGLLDVPFKQKDSRLAGFKKRFRFLKGAYELDAMPPLQLMDMARKAVEKYFDPGLDQGRALEVRAWQDEYRHLITDIFGRLGMDPGQMKG